MSRPTANLEEAEGKALACEQEAVAWHKNWILGAPVEYWIFTALGGWLFWYSY